jgi:hypothetical protein
MQATRDDCRARTEAYHEFAGFTMQMNEADARALAHGEVTERVKEMARCMVNWEYDELARVATLHVQDQRKARKRNTRCRRRTY